jgi:hypothetical protein
MNFNQLVELVFENQGTDDLTHEFFFRYNYAHIGSNKSDVRAIAKFLNNTDRGLALIIEDTAGLTYEFEGDKSYYFLLISRKMNKTNQSELLKSIRKIVSDECYRRMKHYGWYPAEDLYTTTLREYDPMGKYNVEDDVKDVWRAAIKRL